MEEPFYKERLKNRFGIKVIIPDTAERIAIHNIIYHELCLGIKRPSSKKIIQQINAKLISKGAKGIILGCTELPLLINQEDASVPIFNTTEIHAKAAVEFALK